MGSGSGLFQLNASLKSQVLNLKEDGCYTILGECML